MLQIGSGRIHQVGNEIITALKLDIDLGKGFFEPVVQADQPVVVPTTMITSRSSRKRKISRKIKPNDIRTPLFSFPALKRSLSRFKAT